MLNEKITSLNAKVLALESSGKSKDSVIAQLKADLGVVQASHAKDVRLAVLEAKMQAGFLMLQRAEGGGGSSQTAVGTASTPGALPTPVPNSALQSFFTMEVPGEQ